MNGTLKETGEVSQRMMGGPLGKVRELSEEMTLEPRSEDGRGSFGWQSLLREKVTQTNRCRMDVLMGSMRSGGYWLLRGDVRSGVVEWAATHLCFEREEGVPQTDAAGSRVISVRGRYVLRAQRRETAVTSGKPEVVVYGEVTRSTSHFCKRA